MTVLHFTQAQSWLGGETLKGYCCRRLGWAPGSGTQTPPSPTQSSLGSRMSLGHASWSHTCKENNAIFWWRRNYERQTLEVFGKNPKYERLKTQEERSQTESYVSSFSNAVNAPGSEGILRWIGNRNKPFTVLYVTLLCATDWKLLL